jgi:hypothetical protein
MAKVADVLQTAAAGLLQAPNAQEVSLSGRGQSIPAL